MRARLARHTMKLYRCHRTNRRDKKTLAIYDQRIQELEGSIDLTASQDTNDHLSERMNTLSIDQQTARQTGESVDFNDVAVLKSLRSRLLEKIAENEAEFQRLKNDEKYLEAGRKVSELQAFLCHFQC